MERIMVLDFLRNSFSDTDSYIGALGSLIVREDLNGRVLACLEAGDKKGALSHTMEAMNAPTGWTPFIQRHSLMQHNSI